MQRLSHGGYRQLFGTLSIELFRSTARAWVNASNECFPWYEPRPLFPTPPKGKCLLTKCISTSFAHTAPERVASIHLSSVAVVASRSPPASE